jgi:FkbM family methyltransferase
MIKKIKEWIFYRGYQFFGRNTFSQAGEDAIINNLLYQAGILKPSYLELGVCHPWDGNNTYKFFLRGATGVLVEADESQIAFIKQSRPKDKVLNVGVSFTGEKEADFFIFNEKSVSTFSKEEAMIRQANGNKILRTVTVPLKNINEIISENFKEYPEILSIDIEGLDLAVLSQLDYDRYPIPVICAETCTYSLNHIKPKDKSIEELLITKGYFLYADTYLNGIFVHEQWFKNLKS